MNPPAGRIKVGDRVAVPGGRSGRVVNERIIATNGAWKYAVALDDGGTVEHLDYELKQLDGG